MKDREIMKRRWKRESDSGGDELWDEVSDREKWKATADFPYGMLCLRLSSIGMISDRYSAKSLYCGKLN